MNGKVGLLFRYKNGEKSNKNLTESNTLGFDNGYGHMVTNILRVLLTVLCEKYILQIGFIAIDRSYIECYNIGRLDKRCKTKWKGKCSSASGAVMNGCQNSHIVSLRIALNVIPLIGTRNAPV